MFFLYLRKFSYRPSSRLSNGGVMRPGKADSKFRQFNKIEDGREWVEVVIMEPLDYEQAQNYTLTLTATVSRGLRYSYRTRLRTWCSSLFQDVNSHVSSSRSFTILVEDVNDVVPQFTVDLFTGTVDEELTPAEYLERYALVGPWIRSHFPDQAGIYLALSSSSE